MTHNLEHRIDDLRLRVESSNAQAREVRAAAEEALRKSEQERDSALEIAVDFRPRETTREMRPSPARGMPALDVAVVAAPVDLSRPYSPRQLLSSPRITRSNVVK